MGKGVTAIRQVQTLKHCNAHGINVLWYILTGTPGETEELCREVNGVLPKIMHLSAPNTVTHIMFHRYNDYMRHPDESIPALRPDRGYDFVFPNEDFIRRGRPICLRRWKRQNWPGIMITGGWGLPTKPCMNCPNRGTGSASFCI